MHVSKEACLVGFVSLVFVCVVSLLVPATAAKGAVSGMCLLE